MNDNRDIYGMFAEIKEYTVTTGKTVDELNDLAIALVEKFGNATQEEVDAIIKALGGIQQMKLISTLWAIHHKDNPDFLKFATAVGFGFRIHKKLMEASSYE